MSLYHNIQKQTSGSSLQYHLKQLETQMITSQIEHSRVESVYRTYSYHLEKLKLIENLFQQMPRFDWLQIQNEIFKLHKLDSTLTGCNIQFNFNNTLPVNRAFLVFNTFKQQQQQQQQQ